MQKRFDIPILLIGFNRPDFTKKVLAQIRLVKPLKLYFAVDGARNNLENKKVNEVKKIVGEVDWSCEVKTLFADKNFGSKYGPFRALDWFFKNEEMGIILEDDILVSKSFFYYCHELLNRYKNNPKIGTVSGNNFFGISDPDHDYMFSKYSQTWGWATWRRVWEKYDIEIKDWPKRKYSRWLNDVLSDIFPVFYWKIIFDAVYKGEIESAWDYQWTYMSWVNNFFTIIPRRNLTTNIGIGVTGATHTKMKGKLFNYPKYEIDIPLKHPQYLEISETLDKKIQKNNYVLWKEVAMNLFRKIRIIKKKIRS